MTSLRRQALDGMTRLALCTYYREIGYLGGMHPPERWRKDEVIASILDLEARRATAGCNQCRKPGESCGFAFVADDRVLCVCCGGESTIIRARCGAARNAVCAGAAPVVEPPLAPSSKPRAARMARTSRPRGRAAEQSDATDAAIAALTTGEPLRLLRDLEGPFAPLHRRSLPFWRPPLPGMTFSASVVTGYRWKRPYTGSVAVLDRSGAWVAAASSALITHGPLEHSGKIEFTGHPGYYQILVYPWYEMDRMPHPLGHLRDGTAWVPAPTVSLLKELVDQGRWPDVAVLDSYTGDGVRVTDWTTHINALRKHAVHTWGRQSTQYDDVKIAVGQAMSLLLGQVTDGVRRTWKSTAARPDWTHTWQAQASATLWRWGDDCRQVAPELAPVALRNVDELCVPADAVEILTTTKRLGGRKPLALDPTGLTLGTFKLKDTEEWT